MSTVASDLNKALVLEAFDTLCNKRDSRLRYHSGRLIAFNIAPTSHQGAMAASIPYGARRTHCGTSRGSCLPKRFVMIHGRFSGRGNAKNWIAADILRIKNGQLSEHWDVLQDEATSEGSKSGLPMFGSRFP